MWLYVIYHYLPRFNVGTIVPSAPLATIYTQRDKNLKEVCIILT